MFTTDWGLANYKIVVAGSTYSQFTGNIQQYKLLIFERKYPERSDLTSKMFINQNILSLPQPLHSLPQFLLTIIYLLMMKYNRSTITQHYFHSYITKIQPGDIISDFIFLYTPVFECISFNKIFLAGRLNYQIWKSKLSGRKLI